MPTRHRLICAAACLTLLSACTTLPQPRDDGALQREALAGTALPPPASTLVSPARPAPQPSVSEISRGSGVFVHAAGPASTSASESAGQVVFNFENQPIEAVVKAILGDFLKENYAIAPGVQGNVTFSTAQPVDTAQALPILETLLSWTGNAMVRKDSRYLVLPMKDAVAGNLVPSLGALPPGGGLQARLFPLHYIAADAMRKLLQPFVRDQAFLLVDSARNLLVLAGTPQELANDQRTIATFDVDWLRGMSVGVFGLQHASVGELMPKLQQMFGPSGNTPLAGMLRFIPIERTNAIVVISPQPAYLDEVRGWIERIDRGGGNQPQLYVYDVKNVQATTMSDELNRIYNGMATSHGIDNGGRVGPGLMASTLDDSGTSGNNAGSSVGMSTGDRASSLGTGLPPPAAPAPSGAAAGSPSAGGIAITAVDENNQLLVRCRPSQWSEIESAIKRLDVVPLQVQIETRILEVQLTGEFSFGVQWYLEGLIGSQPGSPGGYAQPNNQQQWGLGRGGVQYNPGGSGSLGDAFFYSFINSNLQAAVRAIETSGNTKVLSAPSLVVMNNQQAKIQVGDQVPVNQTYFAPGLGTGTGTDTGGINTLGQVEYKDTGVILQVRPRVNPGGLVYLTLNQIVSKPGVKDEFGNFPIQKRQLQTQIAVQSGQTVLLGGLIQQDEGNTDTGIPGLNRIPLIGRLFGTTNRHRNRTELIVLITPRVIANSTDARAVTLEYQRQFESLKPLHATARKDR
jgi:general secretion pathway protein D